MFAAGLVDEVRELERRGLRDGRPRRRALGYQQVLAAFDGEYDLAEAAERTAQATRRFVRRQRSWFRRDKRITWLDARRPGPARRRPRTAHPVTWRRAAHRPVPQGPRHAERLRAAARPRRRPRPHRRRGCARCATAARGLGADGVLRVVPSDVGPTPWFMDYRNADGSIAEMCGNGVRVFARYLVEAGLVKRGEFTIGTRAGDRRVEVHDDDSVTVHMGPVRVFGASTATVGRVFAGVAVDVGNPHLACVLHDRPPGPSGLSTAPGSTPPLFPNGVNVEFVHAAREAAMRMRVHERGVGETRSCGTGTVAAVKAWLHNKDGPRVRPLWTFRAAGSPSRSPGRQHAHRPRRVRRRGRRSAHSGGRRTGSRGRLGREVAQPHQRRETTHSAEGMPPTRDATSRRAARATRRARRPAGRPAGSCPRRGTASTAFIRPSSRSGQIACR